MNQAKKTVSFDGEGLRLDTSEQAETICSKLIGESVEVLVLQGNTFGIEAAERVGLELARQHELKEAHFKDLFTSRGREEVPIAMNHLLRGIIDSGAKLTLLDLSDNAIGPIGAPTVINFLESSSAQTLEKLYLNNCGLGPEGSSNIASTISGLKNLREFICGRNRLEDKGATNMSRALSELTTIEVLKLNQNGIRVEGIKKLVDALEANRESLRELDLSDNTIKSEGADALGQVISKSPNLEILRLDDCILENEGFSMICDSISKSPALLNLTQATFEGNEICGHKIIDLIDITFGKCDKAFTLDLLENDFAKNELIRLDSFKEKFNILVDDLDDLDEEDEDQGDQSNELDESDESNGYVDLGNIENEIREIVQDFMTATSAKPFDPEQANSTFNQLITTGVRPGNGSNNYQAIQILCEELGLMKSEATRKKKPLARDAIVYIGKRSKELPPYFKDFFEAVVTNDDELSCGKLLFQKLDI